MTALRIVLKEALPAFHPGEVLEGRLEGELAEPVDLRLTWRTEGAVGREEPEIVRTERLETLAPFQFKLPEGPWSFEGKLFSIHWSLEAVSTAEDVLARVDFVLSPSGSPLR